jgi:uncharacterized repeat protein (TIGR03803 family)
MHAKCPTNGVSCPDSSVGPQRLGGWQYRILHSFTGSADGNSSSALIVDAAGDLYGTSSGGGAYGYGVVFKLMLSPEGIWTEQVLYQFTGADDGAFPSAALIFDRAGNLYGTAVGWGTALGCIVGSITGCGLVFKLMPNSDGSWTEQVLHEFAGKRWGISRGCPDLRCRR